MKKSKKILLKWAATYGEDESDVKASMYNEDMMIEFAKYYHKQKLTLTDVVGQSEQYFCEHEEVGYNKRCKQQCSGCNWIENL
jgi:hypothetical protein